MKIGAHVSISGGIYNAPDNARQIDCEVFQMFSRSPRGGKATKLTSATVKKFQDNCKNFGFKNYYIHTPYYINLASANNRIRQDSISIIREELERGQKLGAKAVMTHLGSAKDFSRQQAINQVIEGIKAILKGYQGNTQFLIENAAGTGKIIGDSFVEIAAIIKRVETSKALAGKVGICLDTCHAFATGYDLRTRAAVDKTIKKFDEIIGIKRLVLLHGNDSMTVLAARRDRHANIGKGLIGKAGFKAVVNHPKFKKLDLILETPWQTEATVKEDINALKKLRKGR